MAALGGAPIAVVGLGVIGGSVVKALVRERATVRAYAPHGPDSDKARRAGVDVTPDLQSCLAGARVALIAVPLTTHAAVACEVVALAPPETILLHAGSLQTPTAIYAAADHDVPRRPEVMERVVGTHPLAGSHRSGFDAANADLFRGCVVFVEDRADADARAAAEDLWRTAGAARLEYRSAEEHDHLMTWVSHLPQLASTALADAIATSGAPSSALGPGGRDATRLAVSPFATWSGILAGARPEAARVVAALERSAAALRDALERSDMAAVERIWSAAAAWRQTADAPGAVADPPETR